MAVVASILFLGLLMMKVVLAISTVLVFVGMPIAIVLSPVVSWIPRVLARAFVVCLAVPFVWAVCFAASGAMLNDGLFLKGSSGFFDALLEPLAAIALLWMMLLLPSRLAQMAMLGAGAVRGGFVSRAVSYAAGSQMRDAARQHLPGWAGGGRGGSDQRARATDSRLGARLSAESVLAASKAAGGGAADGGWRRSGFRRGVRRGEPVARTGRGGSSGESGAGWLQRARGGGSARAYSPPPLASRQGAVAEAGGLRRPSWRQDHFDAEMLEASLREQRQPVSAEQARQARDALPVSHAGRGAEPGRRSRAAGAAASRLSGAGGVDAGRAGGDPHAGGGQPGGPRAGVLRRQRVDVGVRRERRPDTDARWVGRRDPRASPARGPAGNGGNGSVGTHAAGSAAAGAGGRLVNPAPAHLEAKLRFGWDFTVGQIAAMVGGILIGFAWANWLSPIHGIGAAVTGVYVGGLPVAAGFVASQTEFDLGAVVLSAVRWRRAVGRFVAGAGVVYRVRGARGEDEARDGEDALAAVLDPELLWGGAAPVAASGSGRLAAGERR